MSLIQTIKADQVQARKQKLAAVASLLTTLIGEAEMIGKNAGSREVTDAEVIAMTQKFVKNISETITILGDNDPRTLVLIGERCILEKYLPKQLSEAELRVAIQDIIGGIITASQKPNMGSLMKVLKERFEGQYDGKMASMITKEELSK